MLHLLLRGDIAFNPFFVKNNVQTIINKLELSPHPEGGFFRETYRSEEILQGTELIADIDGQRNCCTSIYFLLTSDSFSAFHRIRQDEIWHFYSGSPVEIYMINEAGEYQKIRLGLNLSKNIFPQFTVKANTWFAANVSEPNSYGLVGCTVSPGFDFRDFELASRAKLIREYPKHEDIIRKFTR